MTTTQNDCIPWEGYITKQGYGVLMREGRRWFAHRFVMLQHHAPIAGLEVMHRCDNPCCVNIEHLTIGTHADNMRDAARKGRLDGRRNRYYGEAMAQAAVDHPGSAAQAARDLGVSKTYVADARVKARAKACVSEPTTTQEDKQ